MEAIIRLTAAGLALLGAAAHAEGAAHPAQIVSFTEEARDQYRMVLVYPLKSEKPERFVLHLRYRPAAFGGRAPSLTSLDHYHGCIDTLREHYRKSEVFDFGVMTTGIVPMEGKPGEYQSNALAEMSDFDGKKVCYSFAKAP